MADSGFNWIWLADIRHGTAMEILGPGRTPDPRLERVFTRVDRYEPASGEFDLPLEDGTADVLILHDRLPSLASAFEGAALEDAAGGDIAILRECRRVLRDGGCLSFTIENGWWYRALPKRMDPRARWRERWDVGAAPAVPSSVRASLNRAGFSSQKVFFVNSTSEVDAASFIPSSTPAVLAHERLLASDSIVPRALKHVLLRCGFAALAYRQLFVLGQA